MPVDPAPLRESYGRDALLESQVAAHPIAQFERWFAEAVDAAVPEPNAMALATLGAGGRPACRIVLLKGVDRDGFVFYTNYESRKGSELDAHPQAALTFWWPALERQVRIEGAVERVAAGESDDYFASRPRGSQVGAWVSDQSRPVPDREALEARADEVARSFADGSVPRPAHWGGYRLRPDAVEFWQGRPSRLHDRLLYTPAPEGGGWRVQRLAP